MYGAWMHTSLDNSRQYCCAVCNNIVHTAPVVNKDPKQRSSSSSKIGNQPQKIYQVYNRQKKKRRAKKRSANKRVTSESCRPPPHSNQSKNNLSSRQQALQYNVNRSAKRTTSSGVLSSTSAQNKLSSRGTTTTVLPSRGLKKKKRPDMPTIWRTSDLPVWYRTRNKSTQYLCPVRRKPAFRGKPPAGIKCARGCSHQAQASVLLSQAGAALIHPPPLKKKTRQRAATPFPSRLWFCEHY